MPHQISAHVQRMHRYLPFDTLHDKIYEENRHYKDSLELDTNALIYLRKILEDQPRLVILTGDAGHGKTHLCARVIRDYLGQPPDEARETLRNYCDGKRLIPKIDDATRKCLRIYKDFSEIDVDSARNRLEEALADTETVTLVCVNEGRLRSILSRVDGDDMSNFRDQFHESFRSGLVSQDNIVHIINLNYQSVASTTDALVERALVGEGRLAGWLDRRSWSSCDSCESREICPIHRNMELLTAERGAARRERIREVLAIVERLGTVVTIREILMTLAYLLTGGLRCKDVHTRRGRKGWQHEFMYYSLLFSPPRNLGRDKLARIPVLAALASLDPGGIASRAVDERLINDEEVFPDPGVEMVFSRKIGKNVITIDASTGIDEIVGNPRSRDERRGEAEFTREVVRSLRRRDFFDAEFSDGFEPARLGFNYYKDFWWLVSGEEDMNRRVRIKKCLIAGLHTIQGLRLPGSDTTLHLVDPAFGRSTNHAAIIARKVPSNLIKLICQSEGWHFTDDQLERSLPKAVDWIEREVLLIVDLGDDRVHQHPLNLLAFDCIMRAASGYIPESFYAHDIRRIQNFLGLIAESGRAVEQSGIDVIVAGQVRSVTLEEGDVIVVGGG